MHWYSQALCSGCEEKPGEYSVCLLTIVDFLGLLTLNKNNTEGILDQSKNNTPTKCCKDKIKIIVYIKFIEIDTVLVH